MKVESMVGTWVYTEIFIFNSDQPSREELKIVSSINLKTLLYDLIE